MTDAEGGIRLATDDAGRMHPVMGDARRACAGWRGIRGVMHPKVKGLGRCDSMAGDSGYHAPNGDSLPLKKLRIVLFWASRATNCENSTF